jgi:hypothetical protein
MKKIVRNALLPLLRLPLRCVGRSSSMLWLHFGEPHDTTTRDTSAKAKYDWTMQIQCPWRISQGTRIVLAYRDFYYSDVPLASVAVVNKSRSNSVLDSLCAEFEATPPSVTAVESDDTGNFTVRMTHDYHVEVFPAESMESGKLWRIFEPGAGGRSFVFPPSG